MSQVAGQGPLHEPLPVSGAWDLKDSLSTPVEEGVRESDRRTEYRTSSKKSPRPKWNNGGHITLSVAAVSVTRGCPFCQGSDSDQPVASRRVQAFVIPQICEKVQQKEIDPSYKSPEASVPEMKRRQEFTYAQMWW
ncbi:Ribonuclease HII [Trichinella spiralis]|uniref:Ribonuclease HII n=1 Tax=Trichinella spiralis TaxID=6334 RepID=A0ABR3KF34_TRISP